MPGNFVRAYGDPARVVDRVTTEIIATFEVVAVTTNRWARKVRRVKKTESA